MRRAGRPRRARSSVRSRGRRHDVSRERDWPGRIAQGDPLLRVPNVRNAPVDVAPSGCGCRRRTTRPHAHRVCISSTIWVVCPDYGVRRSTDQGAPLAAEAESGGSGGFRESGLNWTCSATPRLRESSTFPVRQCRSRRFGAELRGDLLWGPARRPARNAEGAALGQSLDPRGQSAWSNEGTVTSSCSWSSGCSGS